MATQVQSRPNDTLTRHMLYPFTNASFAAKNPPLVIEGGDGVYVTDGQGKRYIDGQAGLWNVNVGHGREEIKQAIRDQLDRLSYYSLFGGTTTTPSVELADVLCRMAAHEGMVRAFFSSGGSEANEAAFKLARQYWRQAGEPTRHKIISLKRAYHGVTLGALSANGTASYREHFEPLLAGFSQVETPHVYRNPFTTDPEALGKLCAELLEREIVYQNPKTVAAFIAEPVQGAGGVIVPPANFWPLRARSVRPPRRAVHLRRGRDRIRAPGLDVRLPALGREARHHGLRQGHQQRLRAARRHPDEQARRRRLPDRG